MIPAAPDDEPDEAPGDLDDLAGPDPGLPHGDDGVPAWARLPGVDYGERSHLDDGGRPRIVERHLVVEPEAAGLRLDHFLKLKIPRMSRTRLQAVIEATLVRPSGRPLRAASQVVAGEQLTIRRRARAEPAAPRTFAIVHQDAEVLVVDKPAGLPMHSSAKFYFNTLTRVLLERFPDGPPQVCHRLDRETSGCVVAAWTAAGAAVIKGAFAAKRVQKSYLAIVVGHPAWPDDGGADAHVLDQPLRVAEAGDGTPLIGVRMIVGAGGLPSMTRVTVVRRVEGHTLVRCVPVTGRQHQLRAHLAHAGYPIVGDKLYRHGDAFFMAACDGRLTHDERAQLELPRHALHAATIDLPHPAGDRLRCEAPLPAELEAFLSTRA